MNEYSITCPCNLCVLWIRTTRNSSSTRKSSSTPWSEKGWSITGSFILGSVGSSSIKVNRFDFFDFFNFFDPLDINVSFDRLRGGLASGTKSSSSSSSSSACRIYDWTKWVNWDQMNNIWTWLIWIAWRIPRPWFTLLCSFPSKIDIDIGDNKKKMHKRESVEVDSRRSSTQAPHRHQQARHLPPP